MKSTGEVMGIDKSLHMALYKGMLAAGMQIPQRGTIAATISDRDKDEALPLLQGFAALGFKLVATEGTARVLENLSIPVKRVKKIKEGSPNIIDLLQIGEVDFVVNTLTNGRSPFSDGFKIRRMAVEMNVPVLTSLDTLKVLLEVIKGQQYNQTASCYSLQEYIGGGRLS
jgi:carbamoyl-phosphate synthase large subunit